MVKGIIAARGTGKTKKLVEKAVADHATIVCENPERMLAKLHGYGQTGVFVISYEDFITLPRDPNTKYCVDEIEGLCDYLNISAFTYVDAE